MTPHFQRVAIIGVGLIGGSLGMILKRQHLADEVVGIGRRVENLKMAVELGAIDRYVSDPKEGVQGADLIVLATPVDTYEPHLRDWAPCLGPGTIVSDVGSVKGALVERAEGLLPKDRSFCRRPPDCRERKNRSGCGVGPAVSGGAVRTHPDPFDGCPGLGRCAGHVGSCRVAGVGDGSAPP